MLTVLEYYHSTRSATVPIPAQGNFRGKINLLVPVLAIIASMDIGKIRRTVIVNVTATARGN